MIRAEHAARITRQLLERHMPRTTTPRQRAAQERLGLLPLGNAR